MSTLSSIPAVSMCAILPIVDGLTLHPHALATCGTIVHLHPRTLRHLVDALIQRLGLRIA